MNRNPLVFALILAVFYLPFLHAESFTNSKGATLEGNILKADLKEGKVTLFVPKFRKEFELKLSDLNEESRNKVQTWWDEKHPKPAEWVKPGSTKFFKFPDLPKMFHNGNEATAKVQIPSNYSPDKHVPLYVTLGGGKGGTNIALSIDSEKQFLHVGLPYPNPRMTSSGDINDMRDEGKGLEPFWDYHSKMLQAIAKEIPNIDPEIRAIGGFSNGAHCIGGLMDQVEEDIAANFNIYVMIEGGNPYFSPPRKLYKDHYAFVAWGENGWTSLADCAKACERGGMNVVGHEMKGVGHNFSAPCKEMVTKWLAQIVKEIRAN